MYIIDLLLDGSIRKIDSTRNTEDIKTIADLNNKLKVVKKGYYEMNDKFTKAQNELETLNKKYKYLEIKKDNEIKELNEKCKELENKLLEKETKQFDTELSKEDFEYKNINNELQNKVKELEQIIKVKEQQIEIKVSDNNDDIITKLNKMNKRNNELEEELEKKQELCDKLAREITELIEISSNNKLEIEKENEELDIIKKENAKLKSELNSMKIGLMSKGDLVVNEVVELKTISDLVGQIM